MTLEEKALAYDAVMEILLDRIDLEQHHYSQGRSFDVINNSRADGFGIIVNLLLGHHALKGLPISKGLHGYRS